MFLTPSSIYFTNCTGQSSVEEMTNEKDIEKLTRKYVEKGQYPKLQVVEKDGHFYTLNNTQLQVFRKLEEEGHCKRVQVECISIKIIPEGIQEMMTVPCQTFIGSKGCTKICKGYYQKLQTKSTVSDSSKVVGNEDESDDEGHDTDSLSSDSLESSSEDESDCDFDEYGDLKATCNADIISDEEVEEEKESLL